VLYTIQNEALYNYVVRFVNKQPVMMAHVHVDYVTLHHSSPSVVNYTAAVVAYVSRRSSVSDLNIDDELYNVNVTISRHA